jgi:hypothetical protein
MLSALDPISPANLIRLFLNGWIVNGMGGGLIVGRTHEEGHIIMMSPTESFGELTLVGLVSGGEYLLCREATEQHWDRIQAINKDKSPCSEKIDVTAETRILNTRGEPHDKVLLVHGQFIVNAQATKRHFSELEAMNSQYPSHNGIVLTPDELAALKSTVI